MTVRGGAQTALWPLARGWSVKESGRTGTQGLRSSGASEPSRGAGREERPRELGPGNGVTLGGQRRGGGNKEPGVGALRAVWFCLVLGWWVHAPRISAQVPGGGQRGGGQGTPQASAQGPPRLSPRVGETVPLQLRLLGRGEKGVSRARGRAVALTECPLNARQRPLRGPARWDPTAPLRRVSSSKRAGAEAGGTRRASCRTG